MYCQLSIYTIYVLEAWSNFIRRQGCLDNLSSTLMLGVNRNNNIFLRCSCSLYTKMLAKKKKNDLCYYC